MQYTYHVRTGQVKTGQSKTDRDKRMHYTEEELRRLPESILLKYTLIHYELQNPAENPEAAIAQIAGVSESAIGNYKAGRGCLARSMWRTIYVATRFELIREWDVANRIGA